MVNEQGETVALDLEITPELRRAGLAREVIRMVQEARKANGFDVSDRIVLSWAVLDGDGTGEMAQTMAEHRDLIATEVLASTIAEADSPEGSPERPRPGRGLHRPTGLRTCTTKQGCRAVRDTLLRCPLGPVARLISPGACPRPRSGPGRPGSGPGSESWFPPCWPGPSSATDFSRLGAVESPLFGSWPPSPLPSSACELLGEVALQAAAVLPLEPTQVLHLGVEATLLPLEVAEHLPALALDLAVEVLGTGTRFLLELVGLGLGLRLEALGLGAGGSDDLLGSPGSPR